IAHEMAHMWFGDLVTMRWWDDLWLNESFAEYLGERVTDRVTEHDAWVEFGIQRKSWGYTADRRPSTHPVAGNGAADAASALNDFDGISYAKGASVLRQLAARLGDDVFLDGLRRHVDQHAYGNAEFADLISAWTAAGARDLPAWSDAWLRQAGLDTLAVEATEAGPGLRRTGPGGSASTRPHAITVASFDESGHELARVPAVVQDDLTPVTGIRADAALVLPDAGDDTWAKIWLPERSWPAMANMLGQIADPLSRAVIWNALRVAVTDADLDPAVAVEIPVRALLDEPNDTVVSTVLRWSTDVLIGRYLPDDVRGRALARLADTAHHMVHRAGAGSGRQLAAARGLVRAWSDADGLRGWLADDGVPDGIEIDAELRWAVLERLSVLGAASAEQIDAEAAGDRTTQGAVHAAYCRAARPDAMAKQRAWHTLMTDAECSNYELYAMADAFWQPSQAELTQPFVARYFDEIRGTAPIRSGWVVARIAEYAYPSTAVDAATVARTERLLAHPDLDEHIRRSVIDAGDDLRRAVRSRETFASSSSGLRNP
ncbi:MAG: aminopeptidase, partial [Pseudonocardiales bacterium]|nr:aminopeptidase [Pseudonocardiales bacterium]